MHMLIGIMVFSKNKEDALSNATVILGMLCENGFFDYYTTFDEDKPHAGASRWGTMKPVMSMDTLAGMEFAEERLKNTRDELFGNLDKIREGLASMRNEDIWDSDKVGSTPLRYWMHLVGMYQGPSVFLYDQDGEGIRDQEHYNSVLSRWESSYSTGKENPWKSLELFVVPADVHY